MKLGITGTRDGWTGRQKMTFINFVNTCDEITEFHHGDCVGVDEHAARTVQALYGRDKIHCHPPSAPKYRSYFGGGTMYEEEDYITRNHILVDACDILIVIPKQDVEMFRGSGTWATFRYGHQMAKRVIRISTNGRRVE